MKIDIEPGNPNLIIPNDAIVKITKCGDVTEIMYSQTHSYGGNVRKVSKEKYVIITKIVVKSQKKKNIKSIRKIGKTILIMLNNL